MKHYLTSILLFFSVSAFSADFIGLTKHQYKFENFEETKEDQKYYLSIGEKYFKPINITLGHLNEANPLYIPETENSSGDILIGIVDLTGNKNNYYVVLSWGASYDIGYFFYEEKRLNSYVPAPGKYVQSDFNIEATSLIIPSNTEVYSYGHNDNLFNIKKKFILKNGVLNEVKQDIYFSGAKAISLKNQTAYTNKALNEPAFEIKKNESVTVIGLLNENLQNERGIYLIASEFGLVGYVKVEPSQEENQFSGFFWNGD